jgi:hypothetical protein
VIIEDVRRVGSEELGAGFDKATAAEAPAK